MYLKGRKIIDHCSFSIDLGFSVGVFERIYSILCILFHGLHLNNDGVVDIAGIAVVPVGLHVLVRVTKLSTISRIIIND